MSSSKFNAHEDALKSLAVLTSAQAKLIESINLDYSSVYGLDPRDLGIGDHAGFLPYPGTNAGLMWLNRQKRGEFIPAFLTQEQARIYRQRVRAMVVNNEIALNVINVHQAYAVGDGFNYEVSPRPGVAKDAGVIRDTQMIVDAFVEHNELGLRENEIVARMLIDGEAFLRLFCTDSGLMSVRFVEPEHIYSPAEHSDTDSFGVITVKGDVEGVRGYWVICGVPVDGAVPEPVLADEIVHFKHPETPSTSKRGLSAFYPIEGTLRAADDLLTSTVSIAKARAKIAWIRKLQGMTSDVAAALVAAQANVTATDPVTSETLNMERYRPGSILTTNADIEMPAANIAASDHVAIMQMVLRVIAARFSMPEYLLSSDASNANYSSTLVAESPWVKSMERLQGFLIRLLSKNRWEGHRQSLIWRQLCYASKLNLLPKNIRQLVDIQAQGPSLVVRDVAKEAQVDEILHRMKVKSIKTIQLSQGLDPDEEAANFEEEGPSPEEQQQAALQQQQMAMQQQAPNDTPPPGVDKQPVPTDQLPRLGEACVPNKKGRGHHDDRTGHPCSPHGRQGIYPCLQRSEGCDVNLRTPTDVRPFQ